MQKRPPVVKPSRLPGVIAGQIIPVYRPLYVAVTATAIVLGGLLLLVGLNVVGPGLGQGELWLAGLGLIPALAGTTLLALGQYHRTHAPHLIIGDDRVQF